MQKITPFLWFDHQAEDAARFYTSVFQKSKFGSVTRYSAAAVQAAGRPKGSVMTVTFQIEGHQFTALNGGPQFKFTEAISFVVNCETQKEIDHLWEKLSQGGTPGQCGWLKDKWGLSWQIVPTDLGKMLQEKNGKKAKKVMEALLKMKKLDIKALRQVYEQG